jgi:transcriptional regulator with XRE-family HTH domain
LSGTLTGMSLDQEGVDPTRLGDAMDKRRVELGLTWEAVARRAGVSRTTLNEIRKGNVENTQLLTKRAVQRALEWEPNSIDHVLAGGEPTPTQASLSELRALQAARDTGNAHVTIDDILVTLRVAAQRDDNTFWRALDLVNDLHNPLRNKPTAEPTQDDRTA